jgi:hypothetical protein
MHYVQSSFISELAAHRSALVTLRVAGLLTKIDYMLYYKEMTHDDLALAFGVDAKHWPSVLKTAREVGERWYATPEFPEDY